MNKNNLTMFILVAAIIIASISIYYAKQNIEPKQGFEIYLFDEDGNQIEKYPELSRLATLRDVEGVQSVRIDYFIQSNKPIDYELGVIRIHRDIEKYFSGFYIPYNGTLSGSVKIYSIRIPDVESLLSNKIFIEQSLKYRFNPGDEWITDEVMYSVYVK